MPEGVGYVPKSPLTSLQFQEAGPSAEKAKVSKTDELGSSRGSNSFGSIEVLMGKRSSNFRLDFTYESLRPLS